MQRTVTVTLSFDPTEYQDAEDTPRGAIDLAFAMLNREVDLPDDMDIACENETLALHVTDVTDVKPAWR